MYILGFIVLFLTIGYFIGKNTEDEGVAYGLILIITIAWAFFYGPWAIATFIELIIGYIVGAKFATDDDKAFYADEEIENKYDFSNEEDPKVLEWKRKNRYKLLDEYDEYIKEKPPEKRITFEEYLTKEKRTEEKIENFASIFFGKDKRSRRQKILDEMREERNDKINTIIGFSVILLISIALIADWLGIL